MNSSTRTLIFRLGFAIIIFLLVPIPTSASTSSFHFSSFNARNFTLLGDSYLKNGVVGLTRDVTVPTTSSGSIIYNTPIQFFDSDANITASFSAKFSFSISNINPTSSSGDGLTFFLSPDNQSLGSPGGYLGLVNSSELTKNRFIAFEFDTKLDPHFNDPNDNHVGLDVNSLISIQTANLLLKGIDLKSGDLINVWIEYKNEQKVVRIYMGYSNTKPMNPVLEVKIDLSEHLKEFVYVGFSGSSEGSTELHLIESFGLQIFGFFPVRPHFRTHNVSDSSVIITPPPRLESNSKNHRKRIGLALVIAGPVFCCVVLIVFGYVSAKKWEKIKKQKSFKAEMVTGPRQFSYRELKFATRGFHSSRILGNGAFGTVYKAYFMSSGIISAVKRSKHSHEGKSEFLAELSIIACLRHKNLVQLQGWCVEKGELLLVYDYMLNGSLDKVLYGVVVLEVACGRQPIERETGDQKMVNLVDWVWKLHSQGRLLEAADQRLKMEFDVEQMKKLLLVGLSCANPDCLERPNMRKVLQILNNEAGPVLVPKSKPTLIFSSSLPLCIEDIVSDYEQESQGSDDLFQDTVQGCQNLKEIC
ncbi:hypothetical protein SOVF_020640 [Spinacia oleracea]|nr:hypothetical protein SOVF_020640 [Spinacia oleracea]